MKKIYALTEEDIIKLINAIGDVPAKFSSHIHSELVRFKNNVDEHYIKNAKPEAAEEQPKVDQ